MLTSTSEDCLEAILTITENGGQPTTLQEIAAALGTGRETTETAIASLIEEGYLTRAPDNGLSLTEKGRPVASKVARKHRVLQCFLTEMLGVDCKEGDTVRVAVIRGPRRNRRLLDLGIFPGEIVQIRRKLPNQSVVVRAKGCDVAISPEIARSIIVESCP